jgi:hypothetical protein
MGDVRMRKDFSSVEALQPDKKHEADKDKLVMDGVSTILSMPISSEAKAELLKDTYDFTDEMASLISTPNEIENNL